MGCKSMENKMIENSYWVSEWAKIRQDELVRFPNNFKIHECFIQDISRSDFESAFRELWHIFNNIYNDIATAPECFGMPLYKTDDYSSLSSQARDSRNSVYRPFQLLFNLMISGSFNGGIFIFDKFKFKEINKVKSTRLLLNRLGDYGFVVDDNNFISYPDNEDIIRVLKLMADKSYKSDRLNDFFSCHYKLFQDDFNTADYGFGPDIVADKMHTKEERDFIYEMDAILRSMGYFSQVKIWNEGPGYAYYDKESVMKANGPYNFLLLSWKAKLRLYLRIRNASNCIDYLKECPDTVKQMFMGGDYGCKNRYNKRCKFGQEYSIDGNSYWRCGCYIAPFHISPKKCDIPHYIKLVELGVKK